MFFQCVECFWYCYLILILCFSYSDSDCLWRVIKIAILQTRKQSHTVTATSIAMVVSQELSKQTWALAVKHWWFSVKFSLVTRESWVSFPESALSTILLDKVFRKCVYFCAFYNLVVVVSTSKATLIWTHNQGSKSTFWFGSQLLTNGKNLVARS